MASIPIESSGSINGPYHPAASPFFFGFVFQIDNGIPIESWFDDTTDEELLHLLPLLKQLISESEIAGGTRRVVYDERRRISDVRLAAV